MIQEIDNQQDLKYWIFSNIVHNPYVGGCVILTLLLWLLYRQLFTTQKLSQVQKHQSSYQLMSKTYSQRAQNYRQQRTLQSEILQRQFQIEMAEQRKQRIRQDQKKKRQSQFNQILEQKEPKKVSNIKLINNFIKKENQSKIKQHQSKLVQQQQQKERKKQQQRKIAQKQRQKRQKQQKLKEAQQKLSISTNLEGYSYNKQKFINDLDKGLPSIIMKDTQSKDKTQKNNEIRRDNRKSTIEGNLFQKGKNKEEEKQIKFGNISNMEDSTTSLFAPHSLEQKKQEEKKKVDDKKPSNQIPQNLAHRLSFGTNQNQQTLFGGTKVDPKPSPPTQLPQQQNNQLQQHPSSPPQIHNPPNDHNAPSNAANPSQQNKSSSTQLKNLSAQQYLQNYIKYVQNLKEQLQISQTIHNLQGSRSQPQKLLTQIKSQINKRDKTNQKQMTTFGLKLFDSIVYKFFKKSNIKSGLERIPPKSRTDQCQKNSINCYVLSINMLRLMPQCKKIWVIVFGKLLKMLDFIYKRKNDLESYHKLELIQNGYIRKYKEVHSMYLSRIDFLVYMLFGLTAFDPILVVRQVEEKEISAQRTRIQMQSWGNTWSYAEFWSLCQAVHQNKHESYFKPIVLMNILYVLCPRIYQHKKNPTKFIEEYNLFTNTIQHAKKYLSQFKKMKQMKILSECDENDAQNYEYDGDDFVKSIKILDNRFSEKSVEIKLKAQEYMAKANIFYYFTKQK